MLLATDYPFLNIMWTMFIFGVVVMFIWAVIMCLMDNFRRRDHGGFAKAMWTLFLIFVPVIGLCFYMIARPDTDEQTA